MSSQDASTSFKYDALPESGWFRLLKLHRNGTKQFSADLITTSIDKAPPYYALSYCWGKKTSKRRITINQKKFSIYKTPLRALEILNQPGHLSKLDPPLEYVWLDSVCINQKDDAERGHQVQQMGSVYGEAVRTLIWLDQDDGSVVQAFDLIRRTNEVCLRYHPIVAGERSPVTSDYRAFFAMEQFGLPAGNDKQWDCVKRLLQRPWFTRLWETVISVLDPIILCGYLTLRLDVLAGACAWFLKKGFFTADRMPYTCRNVDEMWFARTHADCRAIDIVCRTVVGHFQAKDPRDMVFGLLGISATCSNAVDRAVNIPATYSLGEEEVLRNLVHAVISARKNLGILYLPMMNCPSIGKAWGGVGRGSRMQAGSSWLPNLAGAYLRWRPLGVHTTLIDGKDTVVLAPQVYNCTASLDLPARLVDGDPHSLCLWGLETDRVAVVLNPNIAARHFKRGPEGISGLARQIANHTYTPAQEHHSFVRNATTLCELLISSMREPLLPDLWEASLQDGRYRDLESLLDAFLFCTTGGRNGDTPLQAENGMRESMIAYLSISQQVTSSRSPRSHVVQSRKEELIGRYPHLKYKCSMALYQTAALRHCTGLRFFVTEKGHIGTADLSTKVGDAICVLFGGNVPFVLRPRGSQWLFVGHCFMHDLAGGQAIETWRHGSLKDQVFVIK